MKPQLLASARFPYPEFSYADLPQFSRVHCWSVGGDRNPMNVIAESPTSIFRWYGLRLITGFFDRNFPLVDHFCVR